MELFVIYLWLKLDSVQAGLFVLLIVCGAGTFATTMLGFIEGIEVAKKYAWRLGLGFFFCGLLLVAVPSSKDVAILVGASYGLDVAKSPEGQKVWTLMRGKANELLDAELKKLAPQEKK